MQDEKKNFIARALRLFDWPLFISMGMLIGIGFIAVYSAASRFGHPEVYYARQLLAVVIGLVGFVILLCINYRFFREYSPAVYGLSTLLLIAVLIFGEKVRGSRSWFNLHIFSFQPVEITKLLIILVLASYLDKFWSQVRSFKGTLIPIFLVALHIGLILLQPDFSSSLVYFPILLVMLYLAGAQVTHLAGFVIFGGILAGIPLLHTFLKVQPKLLAASPFLKFICSALEGGLSALIVLSSVIGCILLCWWFLSRLRMFIPIGYPIILIAIVIGGSMGSVVFQRGLKEYQRKRLIVFLNPDIDPLGAGYNITQSAIAIGSGRLFGKGFKSGTQSHLGFLPEQHTDFIFSVIGEEYGFFLSLGVLTVYFIFIWRAFRIGLESRDRYGTLVACGIACMFAFYGIINIGMVMGIMPVTGLPFPFVSYGGSSLVSSIFAVGLLSSIYIRRYTH
ncbi:MAG: rod shape-determining protein RodA [bacterium]